MARDADGTFKSPWEDSFMKPEIVHQHFTLYNNTRHHGDFLIPEDADTYRGDPKGGAAEYGCDVEDVETVFGYFARLSAPGYLDSTDWCGPFTTEKAARRYLNKLYLED